MLLKLEPRKFYVNWETGTTSEMLTPTVAIPFGRTGSAENTTGAWTSSANIHDLLPDQRDPHFRGTAHPSSGGQAVAAGCIGHSNAQSSP